MRIVVRTLRAHGSDDDSYFNSWDAAIKYMKRARRMRSINRAIDFTISFTKGE